MARCDWCESQSGVQRVTSSNIELGEANLCVVCQACLIGSIEKIEIKGENLPHSHGSAYKEVGTPVALVHWLIPRILD